MRASCTISAKSSDESGATSEGLSTAVQPAASAGATLRHTWWRRRRWWCWWWQYYYDDQEYYYDQVLLEWYE